MDKYIGKRLDGRYLVDELVGIGGMANVYKATDVSNGPHCGGEDPPGRICTEWRTAPPLQE